MTVQAAAAFDGGFADPVLASQAVFRGVMDAFSTPGRIVDLGVLATAPAPLAAAAAGVLACLVDYDTPVWFEDAKSAADASAWVTFQTGARIAAAPEDAAFAVLSGNGDIATWSRFPVGIAEYPDRSATLLLPVPSFEAGKHLVLSGPGIASSVEVMVDGLPDGFLATMAANAAAFPLGFDLLLVCGSAVIALPRTTKIAEA